MPFEVRDTTVRGHPVLAVDGELDLLTVPVLARAVETALATTPVLLVIDLTATTFIDSSGARQVVRSARAAGRVGASLQVVCPPGNRAVRLVIDLLDLEALVPVVASVELVGESPQPGTQA